MCIRDRGQVARDEPRSRRGAARKCFDEQAVHVSAIRFEHREAELSLAPVLTREQRLQQRLGVPLVEVPENVTEQKRPGLLRGVLAQLLLIEERGLFLKSVQLPGLDLVLCRELAEQAKDPDAVLEVFVVDERDRQVGDLAEVDLYLKTRLLRVDRVGVRGIGEFDLAL